VLPEVGVPAAELDWAARAYAWVDWRFEQVRAWFERQTGIVRSAVLLGPIAAAAILVWLLIDSFA
jgi:hypothetical protein